MALAAATATACYRILTRGEDDLLRFAFFVFLCLEFGVFALKSLLEKSWYNTKKRTDFPSPSDSPHLVVFAQKKVQNRLCKPFLPYETGDRMSTGKRKRLRVVLVRGRYMVADSNSNKQRVYCNNTPATTAAAAAAILLIRQRIAAVAQQQQLLAVVQ